MEIYHQFPDSHDHTSLRGCSLALGNFDGVHLGHQALFREAKRHGRAAALTFDPHPGKVLQPQLAPQLITLLPRKLELFSQFELDAAIVLPFSRQYAHTTHENFEAALFDLVNARHIVVGHDFTYGAARAGTVDTLRKAGAKRGAEIHEISPVTVDGVVASSSKVREYLLEGRMGAVRRLLGRFFDLDGTVVRGEGRGQGVGFPTANVETLNELRPASGVYAVRLAVIPDGKLVASNPWVWRDGAANIGVKPTFGGEHVSIEVHVLDFSDNLYDQRVRVEFIRRIRPEHRFGSVGELTAQIERDVQNVREGLHAPTLEFLDTPGSGLFDDLHVWSSRGTADP